MIFEVYTTTSRDDVSEKEFNSLEELLKFVEEQGCECIIDRIEEGRFSLEIYNDWRE